MCPGGGGCLRLAPGGGPGRRRKRTASVGPPKNLEKILSSKYGRYKAQGGQATRCGSRDGGGRSLAFLDPVPTVFILFLVLLGLDDFSVPSAKEAHLKGREGRSRVRNADGPASRSARRPAEGTWDPEPGGTESPPRWTAREEHYVQPCAKGRLPAGCLAGCLAGTWLSRSAGVWEILPSALKRVPCAREQ